MSGDAAAVARRPPAAGLFPVWVVAAAVYGLFRPASFAWFKADYITSALAVTMLGMGLTLTFEVRCRPSCTIQLWALADNAAQALARPTL